MFGIKLVVVEDKDVPPTEIRMHVSPEWGQQNHAKLIEETVKALNLAGTKGPPC